MQNRVCKVYKESKMVVVVVGGTTYHLDSGVCRTRVVPHFDGGTSACSA